MNANTKLFLGFLVFILILFSIFIFLFSSKSSPFYVERDQAKNLTVNFTCQENWVCTDWGICKDGLQRRICDEVNDCGTVQERGEVLREC